MNEDATNKRSGDSRADLAQGATSKRANRKHTSTKDEPGIEQLTIAATDTAVGAAPEQEFFIPVHGQVRLTPPEVRVVNHPAFQRLADVYQLGQVHYVF